LVEAFYDQFTYLDAMVLAGNDYLLVSWRMGQGRGFKLDVYKLPERALMLRGLDVPGEAVGYAGDEVFVFENRDLSAEATVAQPYRIHRYALTGLPAK